MKNKNIIILLASFSVLIITFWLSTIYDYRYTTLQDEYKRDYTNLTTIDMLNDKYRDKSDNGVLLEQLIGSLGLTKNITFSKVNNNIAEYKIDGLDENGLNRFTKDFLNKHFKIQELKIEKVDEYSSNISFKVEL